MKNIKILLTDLRHSTVGAHSNYVPIGIGYIASYLKEKVKEANIEIKLTTSPEEALEIINNWNPDIVGLSNYIWNSSLSNMICEHAKKINKKILCVLGGPEFPAGTGAKFIKNTSQDMTYDKCLKYLNERPSVDYFAYSDGEVSFCEVVREFIKSNLSTKKLRENNTVIKGCASISNDKSNLLVGEYIPRIGLEGSVKAYGRDIIPSPYLSGMLDEFLDGSFVPAFETARGCPFQCTFCDQGLDQNKITAFSSERIVDEMKYVAKKLSKFNSGSKTVAIFDSNFGLFEKDVNLAKYLLEVMNEYDWPQYIEAIAPKSNRENILIINDILKNRVSIGLSMQSLNLETLTDIKRRNWTTDQYVDFVKEIEKRGKTPASEIIIPLPGETEKTYYEGIKFLMDHNIQAGTYTLMMLCGAELGRDKAINKYGMIDKWRILPKQFGEYNGKKALEIERICVATNTMSYQEYLNCRNYSFVVKLLANQVFAPIYKLVKKLNISWYDFSKIMSEKIQSNDFKGKLKDIYDDFCKESSSELFNTKDDAIEFYSKKENYEKLIKGDIGENLAAKYTAKSLLHLDEAFDTIFYILRNEFKEIIDEKKMSIVDSCEKWLRNIFTINIILNESSDIKMENSYTIDLDFDFPKWLEKSSDEIEKYLYESKYELKYDPKKLKYMRNEINSLYGSKKGYNNVERAFGRYLMQYVGRGVGVFQKNYQRVL